MADKSLKRFERRDPTGRLLVAYEEIDSTGPYFRKTWGEWRDQDVGPWTDLDADLPAWARVWHDPTWVLDDLLADGPLRATLLDLGVSKLEWEDASVGERRAVVRALRAVQLLNETVRAVIKKSDPRLRKTGAQALKSFAQVVESDISPLNKKGHGSYRKRSEFAERARELVKIIDHILVDAKQEALDGRNRGQGDLFNRSDWVDGIVEAINFIGTMRSAPRRVRCERDDVDRVRGKHQTIEVAREIVERVFPEVNREILVRGIRDRSRRK